MTRHRDDIAQIRLTRRAEFRTVGRGGRRAAVSCTPAADQRKAASTSAARAT